MENKQKKLRMNCAGDKCHEANCLVRNRLETVLKLSDIALWEWNLKTDIIQFCEEAMQMMGLDDESNELSVTYITEVLVHESSRAALLMAFESVRMKDHMTNGTYALNQADGSVKWVQINGIIFRDVNNNPMFVNGMMKDVTDAYVREKKLDDELRFVETIVNTIPNPMFYKDHRGRYRYFNTAFLDYLGMTYDELFDKTVFDIAPEALAVIYDEADKALLASKGHQKYEAQVKYADGSLRQVEFTKVAHLDKGENVKGLLGLMQDVTSRRQEEDKMQLIDRMKETLLFLNNNITTYADQSHFLEDVLLRFQDLFGKSKQSSILEIDDNGIVRVIAHQGYDQEDIRRFELKVEETFIFRENEGNLDEACIINDLARYRHVHIAVLNDPGESETIQSSLEIPIVIEASVRYIISIDSLRNHAFNDNDLFVGNYLRTQFQILYHVFDLYQSTLYMSRYDVMTGLMNRHYIDIKLTQAMDEAETGGDLFFVVMFDLDGLKRINDTYGHHIGDQYILLFSTYLKNNFQDRDSISRTGGDEFVGIIYETDKKSLVKKLESFRQSFMAERIETDKEAARGSFSYGLVVFDGSVTSLKQLIKSADEEMYRYKEDWKKRQGQDNEESAT